MSIDAQSAHLKGDLKYFLKPYFSFRLYVQFKKDKKKCHFYGNEHQVTYQQLLHRQVQHITMSKQKGYTDLIKLVEVTWKHKIQSATIYMRDVYNEPFNTICRRYYQGEIQEINDPVLDDSNDIVTLYYHFENHRLQLATQKPDEVDFKKEIAAALTKNHL